MIIKPNQLNLLKIVWYCSDL